MRRPQKKVFKEKTAKLVLVCVCTLFFSAQSQIEPSPRVRVQYIAPEPKVSHLSGSFVLLPAAAAIEADVRLKTQFEASFQSLSDAISLHSDQSAPDMLISLRKVKNCKETDNIYCKHFVQHESYALLISTGHIKIEAPDDLGLLHGLTMLESLIAQHRGKVPIGWIIDYPATKMRMLHISLWPTTLEDFRKLIKLARFRHYNGLIWLNHFGVKLNSLNHLAKEGSWTKDDFSTAVKFAQENGLEIIPELKLLSHQDKFISQSKHKYLFNKSTYDPRKKELYEKVVFPAIDELVEITGAKRFHIGHDEVCGWNNIHFQKNLLNSGEKQLPANLFLQDTLTLYRYLKKKNVELWMWGDMLVSRNEVQSMKGTGANINGYNDYAKIRAKIPADIIINVWNYHGDLKQFPSAFIFAAQGNGVLGAGWENKEVTKQFTRYVNSLPFNGKGMIATTWYGIERNKQKIWEIVFTSGEIFWTGG
jgi:hypothetical protein